MQPPPPSQKYGLSYLSSLPVVNRNPVGLGTGSDIMKLIEAKQRL
jgi:CBS domain-containing protein